MNILTDVTGVAVNGTWKVAAIGFLATTIASSAYLGYEWHAAAGERDTAVSERSRVEGQRDKALQNNGELAAHIFIQNKSIADLAGKTLESQSATATALAAFGPIKASIKALADKINAKPSTTCEQSLAKQRQAIDGLRGAR